MPTNAVGAAEKKNGRGRPCKSGKSWHFGFRLREGEGENDKTLQRICQLPPGNRSEYIRRVLAGAPVEVHDEALAAELELARAAMVALDETWDDGDEE